MNLIVDQEIKDLITPLSEEELKELEASLLEEGCRDALVVSMGTPGIEDHTLLDGHHRYPII